MSLLIQDLGKTYQDGKVALRDFNLELDVGVFGLLGPNGSGKSTLLEILSLNLMPTTGRVLWEGRDIQRDPRAYRRNLGYLPQTYGFYQELTAEQLLDYMGRLLGFRGGDLRRRIGDRLELLNLGAVRRRKIKSFSGGMKQRLAIAHALLGSPKLLIIDEPTTGLDPGERIGFRNLLFDLGRECTVILSTHIVKDVEFSCHLMTLLYDAEQRFTGTPVEFMKRPEGRVFEVDVPAEEFDRFTAEHKVVAIREGAGFINARFITAKASTDVPDARPVAVNLEDAYLDFIGLQEREEIVAQSD